MKLKEHAIFKSYLYLTREEEDNWKKDIAMWMNEVTEKDDGSEYTTDDYEVQERFCEDIWNMYDCEKSNLHKVLPNRIIAFGTVGVWTGNRDGGKVLGDNLNDILSCCECDDLYVWYDRYNVHGKFSHHDGTHCMTFRLLKDGIDGDELIHKQAYEGGLTSKDITRYTKSLVPYIKEVYGIMK